MTQDHPTRRDILKDVVYVTPAIFTLTAVPAFASSGSGQDKDKVKDQVKVKDKNRVKDQIKVKDKNRVKVKNT